MKSFKVCIKSVLVFTVLASVCFSLPAFAASDCSDWAGLVCKKLGSMSLTCGKMGVDLYTRGLVTDQTPLKKLGFDFKEGSYRMSAVRIDTGRYRVTIQSMTRPDDHQTKEIALDTKADSVYPVNIAPAPEGKYTWNSAIQHDMTQQLGIHPHYEYKEEPLGWVDVRIVAPEKIAAYGFPGIEKNDTSFQFIYKGNNQWELNSTKNKRNGLFVYQNARWTKQGTLANPSHIAPPESTQASGTPSSVPAAQIADTQSLSDDAIPDNDPAPLFFAPAAASDMVFNNSPNEMKVFTAQKDGIDYYLVQVQGMGMGLIDSEKKKLCHADAAVSAPEGNGMLLDLDAASSIDGSGVDILTGDAKERVEAWWDNNRLAFTLTSEAVIASDSEESAAPVAPVDADATAGPEEETLPDGLLFANSDFENGDLLNWTATGDALNFQPTKGDNPTARKRRQPSSHQGDYWIGTFEKYTGAPDTQPGKTQGDRPTGTLTSIPFEITGDRIAFLVGGGRWMNKEYVALVVDGEEVLTATGKHNETMRQEIWDVSAYKGKQAQIRITDSHSGGWGHINADDFRYEIK